MRSSRRAEPSLRVTLASGAQVPLDIARLTLIIEEACAGLEGVERRCRAH